jgi:hypothetical protein
MEDWVKHKRKEKKRKRSRSKSLKRSRSRSFEFNEKEFEDKLEELRKETVLNKNVSDSRGIARGGIRPNKGILANIIQKQIRNNVRMDNDEVNRATQNLQKYDSGRQAVLMSSHLNTIENPIEENYQEDMPYQCLYKVRIFNF